MAARLRIGYASVDSPFGKLLVAATPSGVVRVGFPDEEPGALLQQLEDSITPRVDESELGEIRRQLDSYFEGKLRRFEIRPDLTLVSRGFGRRVLEATSRIPYGDVATYGDVAEEAGSPRGARAAGNALNGNPVPIIVPCHRVVPASGGIGGYAGHEERKAFLLTLEGAVGPS